MSPQTVAERLDVVRARIAAAGGGRPGVTIVGVTKGHGPEVVTAAMAAGLTDLGENYADQLLAKATITAPEDRSGAACRWHFLGHVQRNKVRHLAGIVDLWQGVDRLVAGQEIARRSPGAKVLVQVNVSQEPGKNGCRVDEVEALVEGLGALELDVRGLMAMGPAGPAELARPGFEVLTRLADQLRLPERSMGMSDDLEVAVQEGSTMVRVGRALFGSGARTRSR